ncbi:hypothetical protein RTP6_000307 [Batrachochytrium dendrobatidis]
MSCPSSHIQVTPIETIANQSQLPPIIQGAPSRLHGNLELNESYVQSTHPLSDLNQNQHMPSIVLSSHTNNQESTQLSGWNHHYNHPQDSYPAMAHHYHQPQGQPKTDLRRHSSESMHSYHSTMREESAQPPSSNLHSLPTHCPPNLRPLSPTLQSSQYHSSHYNHLPSDTTQWSKTNAHNYSPSRLHSSSFSGVPTVTVASPPADNDINISSLDCSPFSAQQNIKSSTSDPVTPLTHTETFSEERELHQAPVLGLSLASLSAAAAVQAPVITTKRPIWIYMLVGQSGDTVKMHYTIG